MGSPVQVKCSGLERRTTAINLQFRARESAFGERISPLVFPDCSDYLFGETVVFIRKLWFKTSRQTAIVHIIIFPRPLSASCATKSRRSMSGYGAWASSRKMPTAVAGGPAATMPPAVAGGPAATAATAAAVAGGMAGGMAAAATAQGTTGRPPGGRPRVTAAGAAGAELAGWGSPGARFGWSGDGAEGGPCRRAARRRGLHVHRGEP